MAEFYVHLLNWPLEAESPAEAVKFAVSRLGLGTDASGFCFTVTDREGTLIPAEEIEVVGMLTGFDVREEVDTEFWPVEVEDEGSIRQSDFDRPSDWEMGVNNAHLERVDAELGYLQSGCRESNQVKEDGGWPEGG